MNNQSTFPICFIIVKKLKIKDYYLMKYIFSVKNLHKPWKNYSLDYCKIAFLFYYTNMKLWGKAKQMLQPIIL